MAYLKSTEEEQAQEDLWNEQKMYHAARWVWNRRGQATPNNPPHRRINWEQWFEKKFGEPLLEYAARMREQKNQKG